MLGQLLTGDQVILLFCEGELSPEVLFSLKLFYAALQICYDSDTALWDKFVNYSEPIQIKEYSKLSKYTDGNVSSC